MCFPPKNKGKDSFFLSGPTKKTRKTRFGVWSTRTNALTLVPVKNVHTFQPKGL